MVDTDTEENWATEETQKKIYSLLKDTYKGVKLKDLKDVLKNIEKNSSELSKINKQFTDANQKIAKTLSGGGGGPTTSGSTAIPQRGGGGGPLPKNTGIGGFSNALGKVTNSFSFFNKKIGGTTRTMALLATGAGAMGKWVKDSTDGFRNLYQFSGDFGGSLIEMRRQAGDAGLTFEKFQAVLTKNSKLVANVGTQSFMNVQKGARDLALQFGNFGFNIEDVSDITASYIEKQMLSNQLNQLTEQQRAVGVKNYMAELSALSKATGKRADELMADAKSARENLTLYSAAKMSGDKNLVKNFAGVADKVAGVIGPEMTNMFAEATAFFKVHGSVAKSKLGLSAEKIGKGAEVQEIARLAIEGRSEEAAKKIVEFKQSLAEYNDQMSRAATEAVNTGDDGMMALMKLAQEAELTAGTLKKGHEVVGKSAQQLADEEAAAIAANPARQATNAMLEIQETSERVAAATEKTATETLGQSAMSLAKMLDPLQDAIIENIDAFNDLTTKFGNFVGNSGLMDAINIAVMGLMGFSSMLDIAKFAGVNLGGIFKMLGGVLGTTVTGFGSLFSVLGTVVKTVFSVGKIFLRFLGPVGLVITAVLLLVEHWDKVVAIFDWGVNKFKEIFPNAGKMIMDGAQKIFDIFTFIPRMIIDLLKKVPLIGDAIEGVQDLGKKAVGAVTDMFSSNDSKTTEVVKEPTTVSRDVQPTIAQKSTTSTQSAANNIQPPKADQQPAFKESPNKSGTEDITNALEKQSKILEKILLSSEMVVRNTRNSNYTTMGGKPGA